MRPHFVDNLDSGVGLAVMDMCNRTLGGTLAVIGALAWIASPCVRVMIHHVAIHTGQYHTTRAHWPHALLRSRTVLQALQDMAT